MEIILSNNIFEIINSKSWFDTETNTHIKLAINQLSARYKEILISEIQVLKDVIPFKRFQ